jgi:hypothetical protein
VLGRPTSVTSVRGILGEVIRIESLDDKELENKVDIRAAVLRSNKRAITEER